VGPSAADGARVADLPSSIAPGRGATTPAPTLLYGLTGALRGWCEGPAAFLDCQTLAAEPRQWCSLWAHVAGARRTRPGHGTEQRQAGWRKKNQPSYDFHRPWASHLVGTDVTRPEENSRRFRRQGRRAGLLIGCGHQHGGRGLVSPAFLPPSRFVDPFDGRSSTRPLATGRSTEVGTEWGNRWERTGCFYFYMKSYSP